jgi:hypothetical protein
MFRVRTKALRVADNELGSVEPGAVLVKFRSSADGSGLCRPWMDTTAATLQMAVPWRTFRWYQGQKHYSGTYWSATCGSHVVYESRMELGRLLLADFDKSVSWIVAQPFLLEAVVGGRRRRHIPDYLLITNDGPIVVDVKPSQQLRKPVVAQTFAWTRSAAESHGWRYEVWIGAPPVYLANVRFLAGYRRAQHFGNEIVDKMASLDLLGMTVAEAIHSQNQWPNSVVRAALMHVLWRQRFSVDLTRPLSSDHVLGRAA